MTRLNGQICPKNVPNWPQGISYIDIYLNRHLSFEVHNQARWKATSYRSDCFAGDEITPYRLLYNEVSNKNFQSRIRESVFDVG